MFMCTTISVQAQDMKTLWQSMPAQLTPYLSETNRRDLVDGGDSRVVVENQLGEKTQLDTITANYMQIQLNKAVTWQLKTLQSADGKTVVCSVKTYRAPEAESSVTLYDSEWNVIGHVEVKKFADTLLQSPDTLSRGKYDELISTVPFVTVEATLSLSDNTLSLTPHTPMTSNENQEALKNCVLLKTLKWDGYTFK